MNQCRCISERSFCHVTGITLTVFWWILALAGTPNAWGGSLALEAEVLEGSDGLVLPNASVESIRYAIVHHANQEDRTKLSEWLRTHESAPVSFVTREGTFHYGVLRRIKHCFGRGLLVYAYPVRLHEKDIVKLDLPVEQEKN